MGIHKGRQHKQDKPAKVRIEANFEKVDIVSVLRIRTVFDWIRS
jgi:hypothetical protein